MSGETGDGTDTADGGGKSGAEGTGEVRLEAELTTFEAEFETIAANTAPDDGGPEGDGETADRAWVQRGRELLDQARAELDEGDVEQGWYYLHAAKRLKTHGLEAGGDDGTRLGEAREILTEARDASLAWRSDAVEERLATPAGDLREGCTWDDIRACRELLHEGYQRVHLKRHDLQSQFKYLLRGLITALVVFIVISVLGAAWDPFPSPFYEFSADQPAESSLFFVYILFAGMLGASLFGLHSLKNRPASAKTPQHITPGQSTRARIMVGAASALAIFFFLRSDLLTIGPESVANRGPFLIAIAFVAGYSERFVHSTVESVASVTESESDGGGGS